MKYVLGSLGIATDTSQAGKGKRLSAIRAAIVCHMISICISGFWPVGYDECSKEMVAHKTPQTTKVSGKI